LTAELALACRLDLVACFLAVHHSASSPFIPADLNAIESGRDATALNVASIAAHINLETDEDERARRTIGRNKRRLWLGGLTNDVRGAERIVPKQAMTE
jgi:hypothetical protein